MAVSANHSIHPVTSNDIHTLTNFPLEAKLKLSINRFLYKDWPNEAAQRIQYAKAIEDSFKDPASKLLKAVDDTTGETVGLLVLKRREAEPATSSSDDVSKEAADDGKEDPSSPFVPSVLAAVMRMVSEVDVPAKKIDNLEITYIYVCPASRRQGIGSRLIQYAIDDAKTASADKPTALPLVAASDPMAREFFLATGFTTQTGYAEVDLAKWAPERSGWGLFRLTGLRMDV